MTEDKPANASQPRRFRPVRFLGIGLILLVILILLAPLIVANTGLRDTAINAILKSPSVTASSKSASFGWFSPLSVHGLQLNSTNQHVKIHVDDIAAEKTPWQLLSSAPDLGTITLQKPHVQLEFPLDVALEKQDRLLEPTFIANVKDAALTVRIAGMAEPAIEVDGVNVTARVENADGGRVLTLDPAVIFDKRVLTPRLSKTLLYLIDPTLSDAPQVAGKVSLALDKFRVPIGIPRDQQLQRIEVEGKLGIHEVSTAASNPVAQAIVLLVADMNGKPAADVVRLVQDSEIRFQVRDGRLHHEGLRIGFPDIDPKLQLTSRGSIGLDQTLDLHMELPRLDPALRKEKTPAKAHVTGTITNPKIAVQDGSLVLRQPGRKEPLIALNGVNMTMQVENTPTGPVLAVAPVEVFKKEKVSLGLAGGLLQLIDPDLQGSNRDITGEMSLNLKTLRIPLGGAPDQMAKRLEAEGTLTLHQVATEAKDRSPMRQALVQLLADQYGKPASGVIRLVQDAEIRFQLRGGRLHYEGLRIGFPEMSPDLVVSSRGSVGLDETLDLRLELPRLRKDKQKDDGPIQCQITGTLRDPKIAVQGAPLVINLTGDKPALTVGGLNLKFSVEETKNGRMLALAPVTLFEKQKLTPEMTNEFLQLIAPTLGDATGVQGEISLSLEQFRMPLGVTPAEFAKRVEMAGKLQLHQISVSTKAPFLEVVVKVLADMYGKKPSDIVKIAKDAEVRFRVADGRMHHEGLRIGLPDIAPNLVATSRGSVGLDHSLDIVLEIPRIVSPVKKEPVDPKAGPVRLRVTGTIEKPIVTEIKEGKDK